MNDYKIDCRYWQGRKPCALQTSGAADKCADCSEYSAASEHICIIRGSNIGGAVRTTGLAAALKESNPHCFITWITSSKAMPLVSLSLAVDQILQIDDENDREIALSLEFSLVVNLDPENTYRALALRLRTKRLEGITQTEVGRMYASPSFMRLIDLRVFPYENKIQDTDYQSLITNALGNALDRHLPIIPYSIDKPSRNCSKIKRWLNKTVQADQTRDLFIVINVGSSKNWETKRWPIKYYLELVKEIVKKYINFSCIITIGPDELDLYSLCLAAAETPGIHIAPKNLSLVEFSFLISCASCVITADTLAAHLSLAYNRPNILIFGSTSPIEIPKNALSSRFSCDNIECWPCYKKNVKSCVSSPKLACLSRTTIELITNEVGRKLDNITK